MKREQNEREDALMAFRFTEDAWQKYMWKTHPGTDWRDGTHPYNMRRSMQGGALIILKETADSEHLSSTLPLMKNLNPGPRQTDIRNVRWKPSANMQRL